MSLGPALVECTGISKRFGTVQALDGVHLRVPPGTFHAVIGENGAGKSTLAKCVLGFYSFDAGDVRIGGTGVATPAETRACGMGMVFQHFTLVPSMTVAENLVLARRDLPGVLDWKQEQKRLEQFLATAPFQIDLNMRVEHLAAGQKQKVEILKQLYLETRILILDEPTSVLTPSESDEVMSVLAAMVRARDLSVILITHKMREVMGFATDVTVLRRGRFVACLPVAETNPEQLSGLMMGGGQAAEAVAKEPAAPSAKAVLSMRDLTVRGDNGLPAVHGLSLEVKAGEIVGVAGISGNGQRELLQAIGGQREVESGEILASGEPFHGTRADIVRTGLRTLPEEPLQNATVAAMSVAENIALRTFDTAGMTQMGVFVDRGKMEAASSWLIQEFSVRPPIPANPIGSLSGGNVQRAVLARDLSGRETRIFVVANPCFGLDFAATAFVHNQLMSLRNRGGSVLLVSEDLDELLKLSDRILVMSHGDIVHETPQELADRTVIGQHMTGDAG